MRNRAELGMNSRAVCAARSSPVAFVQPGPEEALPLQAHGEIEQCREHLCHPIRAFGDELFHESGHDRILGLRHPVFLLDNRNNRYAVEPLLQPNFQTSGYTSTTAGTVTVDVPKAAGIDEPFYPQSLERGRRSSRAVMLAIAEMYVRCRQGDGRIRPEDPVVDPGQPRRGTPGRGTCCLAPPA